MQARYQATLQPEQNWKGHKAACLQPRQVVFLDARTTAEFPGDFIREGTRMNPNTERPSNPLIEILIHSRPVAVAILGLELAGEYFPGFGKHYSRTRKEAVVQNWHVKPWKSLIHYPLECYKL
jgi:hypothetical protein